MTTKRAYALVLSLMAVLVTFALTGAPVALAATSRTPISDEATTFRSNVSAELDDFMTAYGPRLTPSERNELAGLAKTMDTNLAALVSATSRAEKLAASGAPKTARLAATAEALRVHGVGLAAAQKSVARVTPILQPHLSFLEALGAKSSFDRQMQTYDGLGAKLLALQARQRK